MKIIHAAAAAIILFGCRGNVPGSDTLDQARLDALIDTLMPQVEQAAGLKFKSRPKAAVRTKDQVRTFLIDKLHRELPPEKLDGIASAYRLLGLLPDSVDLQSLFVDLYTEQIAGFYEPDSTTLYAVAGADKLQLRGVLSHELMHALQGQYMPLDSILDDQHDSDRLAAAQAVLEGQAVIVMLDVLAPKRDILNDDNTWQLLRNQLTAPAEGLKVFNSAPLVIRTSLIFPYLEGSTFVRWFMKNHPGQEPFGDRMPTSTEQILHTDRYEKRDEPVRLKFTDDTTGVMLDDTFGEYEMDVLRSGLAGIEVVATTPALDWGGDRMRVYQTSAGPALIWYSVWDTPTGANNFVDRVVARLPNLDRTGYRTEITGMSIDSMPGVQVVVAPAQWGRWGGLPEVRREK